MTDIARLCNGNTSGFDPLYLSSILSRAAKGQYAFLGKSKLII